MLEKSKRYEAIEIIFISLLLVWFLYLFYPFHYKAGSITADGVTYAHIAKNILLDGSLGWQATWAPPLYSILMAGTYFLFHDLYVSANIVSLLMLWLLPLGVYILTSSMFDRKIALTSATLVTLHPHFLAISGVCEPERTYTTLLVFAIAFIWRAFQKKSIILGILAGAFFSFAYLTRSEGLLIYMLLGTTLLLIQLKERSNVTSYSYLAASAIIFILIASPYLFFLKGTYGKWVTSPKSSYVQIWMKSRIYHDNNLGEIGNPELWGLSKNGKLMWQEPKGTGDLINYLMSDPKKNIKVYLHNFSLQIPGRIPNSSGRKGFPAIFPVYFAVLALLAFIFRDPIGNLKKLLFLSSPFLILFVFPIFTEGWVKYLLPYSPFLIILATVGLFMTAQKIAKTKKIKIALITACVTLIATYDIAVVVANNRRPPSSNVKYKINAVKEQKKAGEWAQAHFSGSPNYMIHWSKLAYYLNGRWTAMPVASIYDTLKYAENNKVDYLVYETQNKAQKDQLLAYFSRVPKMQLAQIYKSQTSGYHALFFKLVR